MKIGLFQILWPVPILAGLTAWMGQSVLFLIHRLGEAWRFPYQLDGEEGFLLGQALRIREGIGLYLPIDQAPFVVDNYPPLYLWLWSLFLDPEQPSLFAGRVLVGAGVILLSLVFLALGFLAMTGRKKEPKILWLPALLAIFPPLFYFLSTYALTRWAAYTRVDLPALAFTSLGLLAFVLWRRNEKALWLGICVLFLALGLWTRQTLLAAPAACFFYLLIRREWRNLAFFTGGMVALLILPFLVLLVLTQGRFFLHVVTYNKNEMIWPQFWQAWLPHLFRLYPGALAAGFFTLGGYALLPQKTKEKGAFPFGLIALYLLFNAIQLPSIAKAGAAENYLLEWHFALALFLALGWVACLKRMATDDGRRQWAVAVLSLSLAAFVFQCGYHYHHILWFQSAPSPDSTALMRGREVERIFENTAGPVFSEEPVYALRAGKAIVAQPFIMTQLEKEGKWDSRRLLEMVEAQKFHRALMLSDIRDSQGVFPRYSPALRAAWNQHYRLGKKLPRRPPLQTLYLFVPREGAPHGP